MHLSLSDLSKALGVADTTVTRWIRQGRLPVESRGRMCIFDQAALSRWAEEHHLSLDLHTDVPDVEAAVATPLSVALARGGVHYDLASADVAAVLQDAVGRLDAFPEAEKPELLQRLLDRESLMSTGVGSGVAIPHPRTPMAEVVTEPIIAACFPRTPLDYGAIDSQPVFVLFLVISTSVKMHLQLLSVLSHCIRDDAILTFLQERPAAETVKTRLRAAERAIGGPNPPGTR